MPSTLSKIFVCLCAGSTLAARLGEEDAYRAQYRAQHRVQPQNRLLHSVHRNQAWAEQRAEQQAQEAAYMAARQQQASRRHRYGMDPSTIPQAYDGVPNGGADFMDGDDQNEIMGPPPQTDPDNMNPFGSAGEGDFDEAENEMMNIAGRGDMMESAHQADLDDDMGGAFGGDMGGARGREAALSRDEQDSFFDEPGRSGMNPRGMPPSGMDTMGARRESMGMDGMDGMSDHDHPRDGMWYHSPPMGRRGPSMDGSLVQGPHGGSSMGRMHGPPMDGSLVQGNLATMNRMNPPMRPMHEGMPSPSWHGDMAMHGPQVNALLDETIETRGLPSRNPRMAQGRMPVQHKNLMHPRPGMNGMNRGPGMNPNNINNAMHTDSHQAMPPSGESSGHHENHDLWLFDGLHGWAS